MKQAVTGLTAVFWLIIGITLGLVSCGRTSTVPPPVDNVRAVKLTITEDGVYEVTAEALRAVGLDLGTINNRDLALSTGGERVPLLVTGEGRDRAIRFYGQALGPAAYTSDNVYWLRWQPAGLSAEGSHPGMEIRSASPAAGLEAADVVSDTVRAEEQRRYQPNVGPTEDRWLWTSLFAPSNVVISVATPYPADGAASLVMRVWADSFAPPNPDHHLILHLNDVRVADVAWDGPGAHIITVPIPAGTLRPDGNQLRIEAPGDTGAPADSVLLDWVEISYPRKLVLDQDTLTFGGQAIGFAVHLPPDDAPAAVWDITEPERPAVLADYQIKGHQLTLASDNTQRRYTLATTSGLQRPAAIAAATSPDLRDWPGGADMIVVTVPQFRDALQPLVAAHQSAGLRLAVVDAVAVYDTFTYGRADPAAIRALVHYARSHWAPPAPRFLLLAGDASYDPRGYLQGSEVDLVPTQLVNTTFTGWTASDVWYALPLESRPSDEIPVGSTSIPPRASAVVLRAGENGSMTARPVLAVGRFPAQTIEQMKAMVAKTLAYERGDTTVAWRQSALFLADNDDPGFATEATAFASILRGYASRVVTIDGDGSQARAALLHAFADGVGLVGYFGHGSMNLWAKEKILSADDVPNLLNRDRLPVVFTMTCLSGFFAHPQKASLGEALLRAQSGGAVAALVPSSAATLVDESPLSRQLARALTRLQSDETTADQSRITLGDAVLNAQGGLSDLSGSTLEVLLTFNLLGDPALTLRH
jgi:hypothetical protein